MELMRLLLLPLHLAAGLAALGLFWVPALSKKGSAVHRAAGRWYVRAMSVICVTGCALAFIFIAGGRIDQGLFLLFLGLITGTALWNGWRVLRAKRDPARYFNRVHGIIGMLNIACGLGMIVFGIAVKAPLFYSFGPVGLVIGGGMLGLLRKRMDDPKFWLYEHFTGMIGSGIASHVAFLAFGGRQLFGWTDLHSHALLLWLTPLVVGTAAITALNFWYRRKSAALPAAAAA